MSASLFAEGRHQDCRGSALPLLSRWQSVSMQPHACPPAPRHRVCSGLGLARTDSLKELLLDSAFPGCQAGSLAARINYSHGERTFYITEPAHKASRRLARAGSLTLVELSLPSGWTNSISFYLQSLKHVPQDLK